LQDARAIEDNMKRVALSKEAQRAQAVGASSVLNTCCLLCCCLQDAKTIEVNVKGAAVSKEAQKAQAVAALRREEAVLAQQASDIAKQVCGRGV
jgi:hypothetical protein